MATNLDTETPSPVLKGEPLRSETYRRLVASMPCAMCGRPGPSAACHLNNGKGLSLKTDDRLCWPGCQDAAARIGCHSKVDASGMERELRRRLEAQLVLQTLETIILNDRWPADVPPLPGEYWTFLRRLAE